MCNINHPIDITSNLVLCFHILFYTWTEYSQYNPLLCLIFYEPSCIGLHIHLLLSVLFVIICTITLTVQLFNNDFVALYMSSVCLRSSQMMVRVKYASLTELYLDYRHCWANYIYIKAPKYMKLLTVSSIIFYSSILIVLDFCVLLVPVINQLLWLCCVALYKSCASTFTLLLRRYHTYNRFFITHSKVILNNIVPPISYLVSSVYLQGVLVESSVVLEL